MKKSIETSSKSQNEVNQKKEGKKMKTFTIKQVFTLMKRERKQDIKRQKDFNKRTEIARQILAERNKERLPLIKENVLQISSLITYDALKNVYSKGNSLKNNGKCNSNDNTIYNIMTKKNIHDFEDLQSECIIALLDSLKKGMTENETILSGYNAINHAIYVEKKRIYSHVFIEDMTEKGIDLIDVNREIDCIIYGNNQAIETISKQTKKTLSIMTPVQKAVVIGVIKGKSFRAIATTQKRSVSTIHEHFDRYRKAVKTLYPDGITSATNVLYTWDGIKTDKDEKKPMNKAEYRKAINEKNRRSLPYSSTVAKKF